MLYIYVVSIILFLIAVVFEKVYLIEYIVLYSCLITIYFFLKRLSKKFIFIDLLILISTIQYLLAPYFAYQIFNENNELAVLWDTYMKVPKLEYYMFVLPATLLFFIGLKLPISYYSRISDVTYINNLKKYLEVKGNLSVILLFTGVIFTFINPILPKILQGIFNYFSQLTFVGVFYALFSNYKNKIIIVLVAILVLLVQCVLTGMYGELVFWSLLISTLKLMDFNVNFFNKLIFLIFGVFLIFIIQSIKHEYRAKTWGENMVRGSDPKYFGELVIKNLSNPSQIFELERVFGMANRINQGSLIAQTMNYVPKHEPFANGETVINSILASFVPRLIWTNKPMSGGREMIVRFLGAPSDLEYSYNISPLGEAYVNFGKIGGSFFMLIYGLFFSWVFSKILKLSNIYPSLILWIPIIFLGPIQSIEGDILSAVNSLIKALFFTWAMYFGFRVFLKIKL